MNKMIFLFKIERVKHRRSVRTVKHICYTESEIKMLGRFPQMCMHMRRRSKLLTNGIGLSFRAVCATIILKLSDIQDTNTTESPEGSSA